MKPLNYESKPVISDVTKGTDIGVDMDGEGFKSHKPGAPEKENSQVFLHFYDLSFRCLLDKWIFQFYPVFNWILELIYNNVSNRSAIFIRCLSENFITFYMDLGI